VFAQLRDMLAAKNSTVMAKKYDDGRAIGPQRAEPDGPLVHIRQNDLRKLRGTIVHSSCSIPCRLFVAAIAIQAGNAKYP
jgi:hypothetical protein